MGACASMLAGLVLTTIAAAAQPPPEVPASPAEVAGPAAPVPASPTPDTPPADTPSASATAPDVDERVETRPSFRCDSRSHRPIFKLGQDLQVRAGDSVQDAVVVFGSIVVDGEVCGDLVAVFGNVDLGPDAYVRNALTVVGGRLTVADGADVDGDLVVVGGAMDAPSTFSPGRDQVLVGVPIIGEHLLGVVPWLTRGLLYGRLIVPDLAWNWYIVGITLFVALLLNLLFPRATGLTTGVIQERPLSVFAAGLLVLLLIGPFLTLLTITVIGALIVPVVVLAMFAAWVVGSIAVARWIGASVVAQDDPEDRGASTRSLLIGFAVKVVAYMIPLVGITVWALAGVLGLGAATMALIGAFRVENPRTLPPPPPPSPPLAPTPPSPPGTGMPTDAAATASTAYAYPPPAPPTGAGSTDLRQFPRGGFLERLGAFALDTVLVAVTNDALDFANHEGAFFLLLLAYHVIFWTWKATTIGGIIMQLRVVKADGQPVEFTDALVRGLTSIFSIGAFGIGCFWILKDEQRQAWHDIVAGTLVVKVPRGWPLG